jgi:hypothetical protein
MKVTLWNKKEEDRGRRVVQFKATNNWERKKFEKREKIGKIWTEKLTSFLFTQKAVQNWSQFNRTFQLN